MSEALALLDQATAWLAGLHPDHDVRVLVGRALPRAAAYTVGNEIRVSPAWLAGPDATRVLGPGGRSWPPAGEGWPAPFVLLAHEWGHTAAAVPVAHPLDPARAPSEHGRSSPAEARAECFAEWACSAATSTDPLTRELAGLYGWRP